MENTLTRQISLFVTGVILNVSLDNLLSLYSHQVLTAETRVKGLLEGVEKLFLMNNFMAFIFIGLSTNDLFKIMFFLFSRKLFRQHPSVSSYSIVTL